MSRAPVENSYYDHADHGRVKVQRVKNGMVYFEKCGERGSIAGGRRIPAGEMETIDHFYSKTRPADVTVSADAAILDFSGLDPQ